MRHDIRVTKDFILANVECLECPKRLPEAGTEYRVCENDNGRAICRECCERLTARKAGV